MQITFQSWLNVRARATNKTQDKNSDEKNYETEHLDARKSDKLEFVVLKAWNVTAMNST